METRKVSRSEIELKDLYRMQDREGIIMETKTGNHRINFVPFFYAAHETVDGWN
jgi:hypothetical protein